MLLKFTFLLRRDIARTALLIIMCMACRRSSNVQVHPLPSSTISTTSGLPNLGNTCYMNATLQVIARLYPDLFNHAGYHTALEMSGQEIIDKLRQANHPACVMQEPATNFFYILQHNYNAGRHEADQIHIHQQEDTAPLLSFLLARGNTQRIAFYVTKSHPEGLYEPTIGCAPDMEPFLIVAPEEAPMSTLVANMLKGSEVQGVIWDYRQDGTPVIGRAIVGNRLSLANIHSLTHGIFPIQVRRFTQTDNADPLTASKANILIRNPFHLTIEENLFVEKNVSYTGELVGFIHHVGNLDSGHYTAYVKNEAGTWVVYDDAQVTRLREVPLRMAQEGYLYFYKASPR